jgi:hypothetical protein
MAPIRVEAVIESDGVLHIANLPCRKGDRVEATIMLREQGGATSQQAAREQFLSRARLSSFRSSAPYPRREELHERD